MRPVETDGLVPGAQRRGAPPAERPGGLAWTDIHPVGPWPVPPGPEDPNVWIAFHNVWNVFHNVRKRSNIVRSVPEGVC